MRFSLAIAGLLLSTALAHAAAPTPKEVQSAIARSLPYLEKEGLAWLEKRNCSSCHVVPFMLWSHSEAQAHAVPIDAKKLDDWTTSALKDSLAKRHWYRLGEPEFKNLKADGVPEPLLDKLRKLHDHGFVTEQSFTAALQTHLTGDETARHQPALLKRAKQPKKGAQNDGGGLDTMAQLLLGRYSAKSATLDEYLTAAPVLMAQWQEPDGSWKAAGQMPNHNRPRSESDQASTAWAILALASVDKLEPAVAQSLTQALAYLKKHKPGKSHETLLLHMLVERKLGKADTAVALTRQVLAQQNADGGWSWLPGKASDAFATGQSLYALRVGGAGVDEAAIHKAQSYLLQAQGKDGVWVVPPQAVSVGGSEARLKKLVFIYNYWGTAWAAIGLARSLDSPPALEAKRITSPITP